MKVVDYKGLQGAPNNVAAEVTRLKYFAGLVVRSSMLSRIDVRQKMDQSLVTSAATLERFSTMMDDAASWCGSGCELRELPPEYFVERVERKSVEPRSDAPTLP